MRPCMHDDGYPAEPGKRKCAWHLLLKTSIEDQIARGDQRLALKDRAESAMRHQNPEMTWVYPVPRVPKSQWPAGERWCAGCQGFVPLFYCTGSRCKAHAAAAAHSGRLEKIYGIDRADYLALLELQGGVCFICGQTPRSKRLAVDHDHATGEVRGLLCADLERGCNHAVVGSLEARSVDGIVAAAYRLIQYIEHPPYRRLKEVPDDQAHLPEQDPRRDLRSSLQAGGLDGPERSPDRSSAPNRTQQAPADASADRDVAGGDPALPVEPARGPDQDQDEPDWVLRWRSLRR